MGKSKHLTLVITGKRIHKYISIFLCRLMGEEFFDLHLTSWILQTIRLFILQRLEADLQFSAFDGICVLGGKSETESWGPNYRGYVSSRLPFEVNSLLKPLHKMLFKSYEQHIILSKFHQVALNIIFFGVIFAGMALAFDKS